MEVSGIRVGERKCYNGIPAHTHLRPLRDNIVVRPLAYQPSKIIAVAGVEDPPLRGIVIAVGPGDYHRQYNTDRSKSWFSKHRTPCDVKVGDEVEIEVHARDRVLIDGIQHIICSEKHVCGVIDEPDWTDTSGKVHRYRCGLNPNPHAMKHMVKHCTCP